MNTSLFVGIYQEMLRAWPNRWLGFFVAFVLAAVIGLVVTIMPDQYQSKAKIYINSAVVLQPLLQGLSVEDDAEGRVRLLRVLQTTLVNKDNVDRLLQTPGMGFDASTPAARTRAKEMIQAGVTVVEEEQNLFAIDFTDTNPVRARNVTQGLLSLFINRNIVDARDQMTAAQGFLDKQIAQYEIKLRELEKQLSDFQAANADSLGPTTFQARLTASRGALRDAQLARKIAVDARDKVNAQINSGGQLTAAILATDQSLPAVIDRLNLLQQQLNTLLLQYTDRHPDVIATRREIALLSDQYGLGGDAIATVAQPLTVLPGQVSPAGAVDSAAAAARPPMQVAAAQSTSSATGTAAKMRLLQANFAVAEADRRIAAVEAELGVIDQMMATAPAAETTLESLNRDYAVLKENHDQLLRRRESARMRTAADLTTGVEQYRIIVAPTVPEEPSAPDRRTFLLLGTLFATIAGAGLAYALGLLRGTFVSAAEAEAALGLPVIARLTDRHGVLARFSSSSDTLVLLAGVAGLFVAAYVLSAATELLTPLRTEIYRLIEVTLAHSS